MRAIIRDEAEIVEYVKNIDDNDFQRDELDFLRLIMYLRKLRKDINPIASIEIRDVNKCSINLDVTNNTNNTNNTNTNRICIAFRMTYTDPMPKFYIRGIKRPAKSYDEMINYINNRFNKDNINLY